MGGSPFLRRAKCFLPTLNGPCRNEPVQKLSKLREVMRFTSRSRAPLLLSLSKQRMVRSQRRSRIASPRDEARCTDRGVYDLATRLEESGQFACSDRRSTKDTLKP